jgi:hypothetical protein
MCIWLNIWPYGGQIVHAATKQRVKNYKISGLGQNNL